MVRVAGDPQPPGLRAAPDRRRRPRAPVQAQQRAQERPRRDRPRGERAGDAPDRPRLAQQHLVAAVAGGAERGRPRQHHRAVPDGRERIRQPVAARELRPQPRRLVGLVGERPPVDPRQHAAALVLVAVGAGVAAAQRAQEAAVLRRVRPAHALVALAARGPRRHRQRGGEQQGEPARREPADEPVERVPAAGAVRGGVRPVEAPRALARRDRAPEHDRAHAVGAQGLDVGQRALPDGRARLQQEQVVLDQRDLRRPRRRARREGERDEQEGEQGAQGTLENTLTPGSTRDPGRREPWNQATAS